MADMDFRVLQTYEELGQACENAVIAVLNEESDPGWDKWVDEQAKRIRESFLSGLDAA